MDDPAAGGAVLVGDAAGFNDPTIGEGLSVALRDAGLELMVGEDSDLFMLVAAMACGPELAPEGCFSDSEPDRLLAGV